MLKNNRCLGQAAEGELAGPENPKDFWAADGAGYIPAEIKIVFQRPVNGGEVE